MASCNWTHRSPALKEQCGSAMRASYLESVLGQFLSLPLPSCVTFGHLFTSNLSFSIYKMGIILMS